MHRSHTSVTNLTPTGGATAEQVIATMPCPMPSENPLASGIAIDAVLVITGGSSATNQSIRVRRGSLTGTQVGPTWAVGAANTPSFAINALDAPFPNPVPQQYVLTLQQTAATTNATIGYLSASTTVA